MTKDELYMLRALELAEIGKGEVSPNPMVGCVIVHNDKIIGEGWHQKFGGPHAEVNAINSVVDKSILAESTLYVSLEPCSHFGKTPPCADLLIREKIKKVIICNTDPNPLVVGKGIEKLKSAGIAVETGILNEEGRKLNNRFFTFMENNKPYILLKWAETADGFMARENFDSKWISAKLSRKLVHKWRSEEDAIMVGFNTALHDNPKLSVRDWEGNDPIRIVLDRNLELPASLHLFDNSQATICYNLIKDEAKENTQFVKLNDNEPALSQILSDLYQRKILSLFVEGGANLLNQFIAQNLWDEIRIFTSADRFEKGIEAPQIHLLATEEIKIEKDILRIYKK